MAIPDDFHSSGIRGIKEWQFYNPRESRKIKSIPRGPRGISWSIYIGLDCNTYTVCPTDIGPTSRPNISC